MAGGTIGTLAFSEHGTGAHFYAPEVRAVRSNGGVRISGRKSFVTSGGQAGIYLVLVQGEAEGSADAYLVRGDHPGVSADGVWAGLGMAGNSSVALELDDVELSDEDRVGPGGRGDRPRLRRRRALLPRRAGGGERRDRDRGSGGRDLRPPATCRTCTRPT
jgi:alkylation response protein AidB-like acyl-CoA dehydrogenase